ncbi:DUF58 domain-containing protein [Marinigracilibium pacificum]|uniref:DUF58 domain-containing protein n=1 Tax=Marinigracilibium pacificum TaxID=2729599 RepID=A0A848IXS0_9BACT|nr:DUF58 domain-containing protein [Marinigracilibium pacificum]
MVEDNISYRELDQLILNVQRRVEAFLQGRHEGLKTGTGITFSHYRQYMPGDDLRMLDWKMYAKTGKYYVRMSEVETNLRIRLIVDCSASLGHQFNGTTKWEYLSVFIAGLIYVSHKNGDRLNLQWFGGTDEQKLRKLDISHWQHLASIVLSTKPKGSQKDLESEINWKDFNPDIEEEILIVTDGYDDRIKDFIKNHSTSKKHYTLVHTLAPNELDGLFERDSLRDLESGTIVTTSVNNFQSDYLKEFNEFIREWKDFCHSYKVRYYQLKIDNDPIKSLIQFLNGNPEYED